MCSIQAPLKPATVAYAGVEPVSLLTVSLLTGSTPGSPAWSVAAAGVDVGSRSPLAIETSEDGAGAAEGGMQSPAAAAGPSGRSVWRRVGSAWAGWLDSLAADIDYNNEYDRFYWPLAFLVFGSYMVKLLPRLVWQENVQNVAMMACVLALTLVSGLRPGAYRKHGGLLRLAVLTYAYLMPVLSSHAAMHAFMPEPSNVKYLGFTVDTMALWLCSRNAFLAWAAVGCRPPLYLAVPYQLWGLWRITAADFCHAPVLLHSVMQERTEMAHLVFSLSLVGLGGAFPWRHLVPASPHLRCSALLLFYNTVFSFLVPLLLLVPLRRQAAPQRASDPPRRRATLDRANAQIESWLRLLLLPASHGTGAEQQQGQQQQQQQQQHQPLVLGMQGPRGTLLLRWWVLLAVLWTACCVIVG